MPETNLAGIPSDLAIAINNVAISSQTPSLLVNTHDAFCDTDSVNVLKSYFTFVFVHDASLCNTTTKSSSPDAISDAVLITSASSESTVSEGSI